MVYLSRIDITSNASCLIARVPLLASLPYRRDKDDLRRTRDEDDLRRESLLQFVWHGSDHFSHKYVVSV